MPRSRARQIDCFIPFAPSQRGQDGSRERALDQQLAGPVTRRPLRGPFGYTAGLTIVGTLRDANMAATNRELTLSPAFIAAVAAMGARKDCTK